LAVYLLVLMLPIYWLINMSLRSNEDIMSTLAFWPHHPSLEKYYYIFNDPTWVHAFGVSLTYVAINTVISVTVALPAAYAFNRYPFHRRQASVLLAAVEPDGAGGGLRHAVL
jgi:glycerol transport system permease protein